MNDTARNIAAFLILSSAQCVAFATATIAVVIDPSEPANTGFNDPTVVAPVGDNLQTTLGAQRLFVFQTAAAQWGKLLNSAVTITVSAKMTGLTCNGTSAVLGQAGPNGAYLNFTNAPKSNVFYPSALADSIKGSANPGSSPQIDATFNVSIDTGTCLNGKTWWYDTNGAHSIPSNKVALMPVVFHELGHGLGFITFTDPTTGEFVATGAGSPPTCPCYPDIWDYYLFDQAQNMTWQQINPTGAASATIVSSALSGTSLVWAGKRVNKLQKVYLDGSPPAGTHNGCMNMYAPNPLQLGSSVSHWTTAATPDLLMEPIINQTLFNTVDLTLPAFQDIGWSTNPEDDLFYDSFDPNPCASAQP